MSASCRSCGAGIRWATLPDGKLIPLDAHPVPGGNVAAYLDGRGDLQARVLRADQTPEQHEHTGVSHFTSCPNAGRHRKRDRK